MIKKFTYGTSTYEYELVQEDRKTLSLTVKPSLDLVVKSPFEASNERIEIFLKRKWFWLQRQVNFFKRVRKIKYNKDYVSGESFLYLGKQYMLLTKQGEVNKVVLTKGKLELTTRLFNSDSLYNKLLIERWYLKRSRAVFSERFDEIKKLFEYKKYPTLGMKNMSKRWGSYLNDEKIVLNPLLIGAPKECIDYVIIHELCHMKYKDHNKKFFVLLETKCPDWKKRKERLESLLG